LYKLTTQTLPILTYLMNWDKKFQSPFKSDVYFFSTRIQTDQRWGTATPITIRDKEFGAVRLRGYGIYSWHVADPKVFYTKVSGTRDTYRVEDLEGQLRNTIIGRITDTFAGSGLGTEWLFAASAGVKTAEGHLVLGPEFFGSTVLSSDEGAFKTRNTPFELIFGGHATFARDWRAGAGIGPGLSRGYGSPVVRVLASIEWAPAAPPPDRDHDGIPDAEDACPDVPGVRTSDPRTNGCPPAPVAAPADRDGDGIPDSGDACPDTPGVRTDDPATNGCPPDRDKDGIYDKDDACPDEPGIKTDDPATNGCPDRDKDGIPDKVDACPDVPGVKTDDPKTNGCPPDRDKDGIPDDADACPDEPGPPNPDPKKNGCPMAAVQGGQIRIREQVKFRYNSADLDPAGDPVLEAVRQLMTERPGIVRVRVEGHTDNKGGAAYNLNLSNRRAASVVAWLVKHGIDKKRLESRGYGLTRPITENTTEEGRQQNRRVEFHIAEGEGKEEVQP